MDYIEAVIKIEEYFPMRELVENAWENELRHYKESYDDTADYDEKDAPKHDDHIFTAFWYFKQGDSA